MPSLFGGLQRQAAALPPIVQQQQAAPARGRGLFGGGRPNANAVGLMERIAMMGETLGGGASMAEQERARQARMLAEQQAAITRQNEDRLRAQLSPMDGPNGSGTGAAPSLEQQMAALDDARLRDPAVAAQFAPVVQQRRMASLMAGRPIEEQLATELNPERAGQSYASQFEDSTLAKGSQRVRGSQIVAEAPDNVTINDTLYGVTSGGANPIATAPPGYDDITNRDKANQFQFVNTPAGGTTNAFNPTTGAVSNSVQGNPANVVDPAIVARQAEARTAMAQNLRTGLTGARRYLDAAGVLAPYLPWEMQDRADLSAQLDTLKGNITFEKLTEMKANSPNGASGLGALSDNEARMLASTVAALDPSMSQQELERSFTVIDALVKKLEEGPTATAPQGGAPNRAALEAEARRRGLIQ